MRVLSRFYKACPEFLYWITVNSSFVTVYRSCFLSFHNLTATQTFYVCLFLFVWTLALWNCHNVLCLVYVHVLSSFCKLVHSSSFSGSLWIQNSPLFIFPTPQKKPRKEKKRSSSSELQWIFRGSTFIFSPIRCYTKNLFFVCKTVCVVSTLF